MQSDQRKLLKYSLAILQEHLGSGFAGICPNLVLLDHRAQDPVQALPQTHPRDVLSALPVWPEAGTAPTWSTGHLQPDL